MLATTAFIAGAMGTVLRWEDFGLRQLGRHGLLASRDFICENIRRDAVGASPLIR
jgi:hypothetical protein